MWPWNNITGPPRPPNAPRTPFPQAPTAPAPGPAPTVGDMIDYQGFLNPQSYMNFAYDDVPFGRRPPTP
jgi:tyrosinase